MSDFKIGDKVTFGMYVRENRAYRLQSGRTRRNHPERHSGVVTGWLSRDKIVVNETRGESTFTYVFSQRKSNNYILEGTPDVSKKFFYQPLRLDEESA